MKLLRRIDAEIPEGVPADTTAVEGRWANTHPAGQGPAYVEITRHGSITRVLTRSASDTDPVSWNEDWRLYGGIAASSPLAWSVRRHGEGYEGLLQGNLNLGLLVLGTYKTYTDGRPGYFSREFYLRTGEAPSSVGPTAEDTLFGGVDEPTEVDPQPLVGRWVNTEAAARGIARIEIAPAHDAPLIRVWGTGPDGPVEWGQTRLGVYAAVDEAGKSTLSLLAKYTLASMESQLQVRVVAGTLVLASFNSFSDGRVSYFTREFFYLEGR